MHYWSTLETDRIYHWSPMQIEKPQPEGKRIMPETRFTEFPALPVDPRVGVSRSASETDELFFFFPIIGCFHTSFVYYFLKRYMAAISVRHSGVFVTARKHRL